MTTRDCGQAKEPMEQHLHMTLGELRRVKIGVTSKPPQNFTIKDATFTLSINGAVEASGVPEMDGTDMFVMVEPKRIGTYRLEVIYYPNGERLIARKHIIVER